MSVRTLTFRTLPGVSACVRSSEDDALLVVGVTVMEGRVALDDGYLRLPTGTDPVDGRDPIEAIGAAVGNNQPVVVVAASEWNATRGCWDLILVDEIVDPRKVPVADVILDDACDVALRRIDINGDELEVILNLTIPIEGLDEAAETSAIAVQDARICPLDGLDDADWRVDVLDHDEGPRVAWWRVMVTARSPAAVAALDSQLARRTPWKRAAA
jgi:hypothetical protein